MSDDTIYVTKPVLPSIEELLPYLEQIWSTGVLTNGGPLHQELEQRLADYLGVEHVALFANGTIALLVALQALRISGEVITTPFSFVATSHSLLWNDVKPVFVDIEPYSLNLDPERIEQAITAKTTAIMPVHCYGNPCDVDAIDDLASLHNLKVVYDAAHAFGVQCHCGSLLNHGDLSVLSFHATKVFNTFEGGAIVCKDIKTKRRIDFLKNFGHSGETTVVSPGINGKMSELHAAVGLAQIKNVDESIAARKRIHDQYLERLREIDGISPVGAAIEVIRPNHSYFPVRISREAKMCRDEVYDAMKHRGVHPRKYFFPLISEHPMYKGLPSASADNLPVATLAASEILCLPIYPSLSDDSVHRICDLLQDLLR